MTLCTAVTLKSWTTHWNGFPKTFMFSVPFILKQTMKQPVIYGGATWGLTGRYHGDLTRLVLCLVHAYSPKTHSHSGVCFTLLAYLMVSETELLCRASTINNRLTNYKSVKSDEAIHGRQYLPFLFTENKYRPTLVDFEPCWYVTTFVWLDLNLA